MTHSPDHAERALVSLAAIMAYLDKGRDAPGHSHDVAGVWDDDIGNQRAGKAGKPCEWCATWSAARAALHDGKEGE